MEFETTAASGTETEAPAAESEKEQHIAEADAAGGKEPEFTEPAAQETMSLEERSKNAKERRERERAELIEQERARWEAENQKRIDSVFASLGKVNPYTGKLISTQAEMEEYNSENRKRQREAEFKKAGLDPKLIEELINELPDIKQARDAKESYERAQKEYENAIREEQIRGELRQISRLDPSVRTPEELVAHPMYGKIKKLVQDNGHSLSEAFEIATAQERQLLAQNRAAASASAAAGGKSHLKPAQPAGAGAETVTVPAAIAANYRRANPKITDEQIRAKYRRVLGYKK